MKNLIDQLYSGEIYPAEKIVPTDADFQWVSEQIADGRSYLKKKLSAEDGDRLEKLNDMYMQVCSMNCYAGFSNGFRLGALLLIEIMGNREEVGE